VLALVSALLLAAPPAQPPPDVPARLLGAAMVEGRALTRLEELTDTVGARLVGSPGAEAAVAWALRTFAADGIRAWAEPVVVPVWVRGEERGEVIATPPARHQPLHLTALGNSPGTPPGGVTAELVEVRTLEELSALGEQVRGKVVLFQHSMGDGQGYGEVVRLRSRGPAAAARQGAVAALVRSLATASLRDPHTGQTSFGAGPAIPAAAVSVEDALLLHRLARRGPVTVRLVLGCGPGSPATGWSANVVAEVRGRERPEEVVIISGHLDSWDLGTGAVDDGAGVAMAMEALRLIARQPVAPRRTVRAVLFMNEENGTQGGVAYARRHAAELARHVAAVETDAGAGRPLGVSLGAGPGGLERLQGWLSPLAAMGAADVRQGDGGVDIGPLHYERVPVLELWQETSRYFQWHHSAADTFDKVAPADLLLSTGAYAVLAWQLAEQPETLPRPSAPKDPPWWSTEPLPAPVGVPAPPEPAPGPAQVR
jgi:Zn-dependent M28 family amino/carboxypeptidase